MNLFQLGNFKLHSGAESNFKIECDALTDEDLETFAVLIKSHYNFGEVIGVPRGGLRLAEKLQKYKTSEKRLLIVDDVFTTGKSIQTIRDLYPPFQDILGVVLFSRGIIKPTWIRTIFQMWDY